MKIPSPFEFHDEQSRNWIAMPGALKAIIMVCAIELLLLGTLAIWFQLPGWNGGN